MLKCKNLQKQVRERWVFTKEPQPGTIEIRCLFLHSRRSSESRLQRIFLQRRRWCQEVDAICSGEPWPLHESKPDRTRKRLSGSATQLLVQGSNCHISEFYESPEGALMGVLTMCLLVDAGKVTVMPNAFGSFGEGLLNVSKLKTGKVTLVRLAPVAGGM